jgi:transcription elongation factor Elf1
MKYQDKLNELGMNAENLSPSIQKSIATLDDIIDTYHQAKKALENATDEEEEGEINSDIEQMEGDIQELDEKILEKIEDYNKNKEMYAERGRKMQEGRKAKASGTVSSQPQPQPQPQTQSQPQVETPKVEVLEAPKKKTNWALWLVAGIVAIVTVNQVMIRNED